MATAVTMPRWGMIMEEGLVVEWLKKVGDEIAVDEPLLVVESEKAANEVPSPAAGVVRAIVAPEGETAVVGALLAVIAGPDEDAAAIEAILAQSSPSPAAEPTPAPTAVPGDKPAAPSPAPRPRRPQQPQRVIISPAAKRMAVDKGIDWQSLTGSGPRGRIERKDVLQAIAAAQTAAQSSPSDGQAIPLSRMRKAIARNTLQSIQAPQAALCREIDITPVLRFRKNLNASDWPQEKPPTVTAVMVKATAIALQKAPILNARLDDDSIWLHDNAHIGVVVAIEEGVVVPVIREANKKSLPEIAAELNDLTQRARTGRLTSDEMAGGTFTISNAGPLGIDFFQALLYPPQVGALGLGRGRQRAVVVDGEIAVRTMSYFCVSSDHRVVDAEPIGRFLGYLEAIMQKPELLLETDSVSERG